MDLTLIRHAPVAGDGRAYGRRDLDCAPFPPELDGLSRGLPRPGRLVASPAARCRDTARAIWPGLALETHGALLEQDLGAWEGRPYASLPDLGPLPRADLAAHRPPDGESFDDLCDRLWPWLDAQAGTLTVVAHAGTVRGALGWAMGVRGPALAITVAPLSVTRIRRLDGGATVVDLVNGGVP